MQDKDVFDSLNQKFKVESQSIIPATSDVVDEAMVENDFDQARQALKNMIVKGQDIVNDISSIAKQSDHPRAYEVAGQLIKTVAETAKDLLALQKQKKDLQDKPKEDAPKQIGTQNNIVFTGSTNDLLKMLKDQNEKTIDVSSNQEKD